jgi:hypothetical protein
MVGGEGIEPSTIRLKVECSTTELPAHQKSQLEPCPLSGGMTRIQESLAIETSKSTNSQCESMSQNKVHVSAAIHRCRDACGQGFGWCIIAFSRLAAPIETPALCLTTHFATILDSSVAFNVTAAGDRKRLDDRNVEIAKALDMPFQVITLFDSTNACRCARQNQVTSFEFPQRRQVLNL